jgi:uracil permease
MSALVLIVGIDRIKKYFPPQVTGAMIAVIGINLIPTAYEMAINKISIALITLLTALLINKFAKGFIKQLSILIAVFVGFFISYMINYVDTTSITQASLFEIPNFTRPKFSLDTIVMIAPVVLAVFMEHIGDMTTNGAVVGKNLIEDPGLHKTLLGDGLATIVAGFLGGPANTTYGENTAVLAITKNYDPSIIRRTAVFAIILSCVGKFGGFLQAIPTAVMGGISLLLFSMISLVGFKTIKDNKCMENKNNVIIILTIMTIGLVTTYLDGIGISIGIPITKNVMITGLSLAAIVGIILNRILNHKDFEEEKAEYEFNV